MTHPINLQNIHGKTILSIFAHPDDEAFGPAGTIHKLSKNNTAHLIIVTDGAYARRYRYEPDIAHRRQELDSSASTIGYTTVTQLPYEDGTLCNNKYHEIANKLDEMIDAMNPDIIVTFEPRGLSGHLDHIAVTSIINYLFHKKPAVEQIWYFGLPKETMSEQNYFVFQPPGYARQEFDLIVDINDVWELKKKAIFSHASQQKDQSIIMEKLEKFPKEEHFLITKR